MYVKIGKYPSWIGPYQIADKLFSWLGEDRADKIGQWMAGRDRDTWFHQLCLWYHKKFKNNGQPRVKVIVHRYDTWAMDNTLSHIVLPMLKQLKASKKGSPFCDQIDLPEHLRMTEAELDIFNRSDWHDTSEKDAIEQKFHSQFDWILDQMIWSFEQELNDQEQQHYYDQYSPDDVVEGDEFLNAQYQRTLGKFNMAKHKLYQDRKQLGFTLFGKYFQSLWT